MSRHGDLFVAIYSKRVRLQQSLGLTSTSTYVPRDFHLYIQSTVESRHPHQTRRCLHQPNQISIRRAGKPLSVQRAVHAIRDASRGRLQKQTCGQWPYHFRDEGEDGNAKPNAWTLGTQLLVGENMVTFGVFGRV